MCHCHLTIVDIDPSCELCHCHLIVPLSFGGAIISPTSHRHESSVSRRESFSSRRESFSSDHRHLVGSRHHLIGSHRLIWGVIVFQSVAISASSQFGFKCEQFPLSSSSISYCVVYDVWVFILHWVYTSRLR